jgi:hypothetical protein
MNRDQDEACQPALAHKFLLQHPPDRYAVMLGPLIMIAFKRASLLPAAVVQPGVLLSWPSSAEKTYDVRWTANLAGNA